jgi:hypothetical protein
MSLNVSSTTSTGLHRQTLDCEDEEDDSDNVDVGDEDDDDWELRVVPDAEDDDVVSNLSVLDEDDWLDEEDRLEDDDEDVLDIRTVLEDDELDREDGDEEDDLVLEDELDDELDDLSAASVTVENATSPPIIFRQVAATFWPRNLPAASLVGLSQRGMSTSLFSTPDASMANISTPADRHSIFGSPPPDV